MSKKSSHLHGSIFYLFQKFVEDAYGKDVWIKMNKLASTGQTDYALESTHPLEKMEKLLLVASSLTKLGVETLMEKFGTFMVPHLMTIYGDYLNESWKTKELLLNTEEVMHRAVRNKYHNANPPKLNISAVSDGLVYVDYYSKRRMGNLAVGIIKGIARYYGEESNVNVKALSSPDGERVQLRVSFSNSSSR